MIPKEIRELVAKTGSRMPLGTYETRSFDNWKWRGVSRGGGLVPDESEELWKALGSWRNKDMPFLYLYGVAGVGKTHLALAIAWQSVVQERQVVFYSVDVMLDDLRAGYESEGYVSLMRDIRDCDLLVLDDIAAQQSTDWAAAKLDAIVDYRYINALPTILTANTAEVGPKLPERLLDRCLEGTIVRVLGRSERARKGRGQVAEGVS